jgi:hypothetical protein
MEIAEIKRQLGIDQVLQHYGLKPDKQVHKSARKGRFVTPFVQI